VKAARRVRREAVRKRPEFTRGECGTSPGGPPYSHGHSGNLPCPPVADGPCEGYRADHGLRAPAAPDGPCPLRELAGRSPPPVRYMSVTGECRGAEITDRHGQRPWPPAEMRCFDAGYLQAAVSVVAEWLWRSGGVVPGTSRPRAGSCAHVTPDWRQPGVPSAPSSQHPVPSPSRSASALQPDGRKPYRASGKGEQ
jgi:hypothetical protein